VIESETPCIRQLLDVYEFFGAPVLAVMEVPPDQISNYGCIDAEPISHNGSKDRVFRVRDMVEKPKREDAPSNLAIIGRYILTLDIREAIQNGTPGSGGEIQLTDAMRLLLRSRPLYAFKFDGKRYDAGDKLGFLKATVEFALKNPELGPEFAQYLRELNVEEFAVKK